MSTENQEWNPEDDAPIPAELLSTYEASPEEALMTFSEEEEVVDTISNFLNIDGAEFGAQVFNSLKEGNSDPIKTLLMIKKMKHLHDFFLGSDKGTFNAEAKTWLKDQISNTVGKETYKAYGASISIETVGGATTMDYTGCGDIYLNKLYEIEKQLKELIKDRQNYIKQVLPVESKTQLGVRTHKETIDQFPSIEFSNIEPQVVNLIPPVKFSREGIVVRFARKNKK